jgi:NAD(P)-dependent dehydrogenase (short-subunit alcohol dehydrogenase family)
VLEEKNTMSIAVITGANRGIGLQLTKLLRQRGMTVFAACRQSSAELEATGACIETGVDVSDGGRLQRLQIASTMASRC